MGADPLVAVVIPSFNYARFLPGAIDSCLQQTHAPVEVMVVDDGSTDDSRRLIQSYGDRIRAVFQDNCGPAAARNAGIRESHGGFVHFLDADDVLRPDAVAKLMGCMREHPEAGLVYGGAIFRDEEGGTEQAVVPSDPARNLFPNLIIDNPVITSATLARRDVLIQAGLFDEDRALQSVEDYDLWLRIARLSPLFHVPEPLVVRRLHPLSISGEPLRHVAAELALFKKWLARERGSRVQRLIRGKLRQLSHRQAYYARLSGDAGLFRRHSAQAVLVQPWYWKNWVYFVWSLVRPPRSAAR